MSGSIIDLPMTSASVLAASPSRMMRMYISTGVTRLVAASSAMVVIFGGGIRLELGDGDVLRASVVSQGFFDAGGILVLLVGHDDFDVGVPGVVGIAVGEEIDSASARGFDDADVLGRFVPDADGADLDVRMLDGNVGAFADGDFFVERGETFVAFVANVGHVEAAVCRGDFGFGDDFIGGTVAGDVVFEAGGE